MYKMGPEASYKWPHIWILGFNPFLMELYPSNWSITWVSDVISPLCIELELVTLSFQLILLVPLCREYVDPSYPAVEYFDRLHCFRTGRSKLVQYSVDRWLNNLFL